MPAVADLDRLSHVCDPQTSADAIAEHDASGTRETNRQLVLGLVVDNPGCTGGELCNMQEQIDLTEFRRRLTDLKNDRQIHQGDARPCRAGRKRSVTWWPGSGEPVRKVQATLFATA